MSDPAFDRGYGLAQPLRLTEGITRGELSELLVSAGQDAEHIIASNLKGSVGSKVTKARMEAAVSGMANLQTQLWGQVERATIKGMHSAGALAATQQIDRDFILGMPYRAIQQYADTLYMNAFHGVESVLSRRTNGFTLADRIYRNGRVGVLQAAKEIERGLILQQSAKQIAARVRDLYRPDVPGGQSYAAMRLARTEINNAHHDTTIRNGDALQWVEGYQWNLSGSHPKPDICNEYADDDHDDLGPGVFKKGNAPSKPHPHCLCYVTVVQPDREEFLRGLVNGSYDESLKNLGVSC